MLHGIETLSVKNYYIVSLTIRIVNIRIFTFDDFSRHESHRNSGEKCKLNGEDEKQMENIARVPQCHWVLRASD